MFKSIESFKSAFPYGKSFGIRISPLLESANIKPQNIEKHFTPNIPAWCMKPPEILFDF